MATIAEKLVKIVRDVSIEDQSLYTKFVISSLFMFAIPLALVTYLVYMSMTKAGAQIELTYARFIILITIASGLVGYIIIRRSVNAVLRVIKKAKAIAAGNDATEISVVHDDELKDLASAFNRIASDLEKKIKELEDSKNLTREVFQKIEYAITSTQKIDVLFTLLIQSAQKMLRAQAGFIALYEGASGRLSLKAYCGQQKRIAANAEIRDNKGIVGLVIMNKKSMVMKEGMLDKTAIVMAGKETFLYTNILCVPIITKDKVKGIFAIMDLDDVDQAETEDIFLMERVAGSVAAAVENFELNKNIEDTYYQTLLALARVVEAKDHYSAGHLERVSRYVEKMAARLDLDDEAKKVLIGGAVLHDLGKVGIRDDILQKESGFSEEEYGIMKEHSIIGENILKPLRSMSKLSDLVRHHHELYDGSGYPDKLRGKEIPLMARILAIADMYDALTSNRPYRQALSKEKAMKIIKSYAGNKLDPELVDIFVDVMAKGPASEH